MKPSPTNFDTQGDELRGSIRPLKNNYVRMKLYIGIFVALSFSLWACTKKQEGCDGSLKPTILVDSTVIAGDSLKLSVAGMNIGDVYTYNWYGPSGFSSHDSAPFIPGASAANAGRYYVDIITKGGCIYSAASDSILIGAPTIPCSLTNEEATLTSVGNFYFTYISASASGGTYTINAYGAEGDAEIDFYGSNPPATGIYTIPSNAPDGGPGNVQVSINDGFSNWNANPGTVYVTVTNNKVSVSACTLKFVSDAYGYSTGGSFQITQQ